MRTASAPSTLLRLVHKRLARPNLSLTCTTAVSGASGAPSAGPALSEQHAEQLIKGVGTAAFLWLSWSLATTANRSSAITDGSVTKENETEQSGLRPASQPIGVRLLRHVSTWNTVWPLWMPTTHMAQCESTPAHFAAMTDQEFDDESGYTEDERFYQCLEYHRALLTDYNRRWGPKPLSIHAKSVSNSSVQWPRNIPHMHEVSALECDLRYCQRRTPHACLDAKFRIASYYLSQTSSPESQRLGFIMLKQLAHDNHVDAMCFYGILLSRGLECANVNANPQEAVTWWLKCTDEYRHIQATFELATACYLGEGLPENTEMAVHLFRRAANLGHAGAAYMLGECLLYGAGVERDRANALEWLVTAAELGHVGARERVLMVLTDEAIVPQDTSLASQAAAAQRKLEEDWKWHSLPPDDELKQKAVNIERRYTIGDSPRNSTSLEVRRKTIVSASRGED